MRLIRRARLGSSGPQRGSTTVTRALFEANLAEKLVSRVFRGDVIPLLRTGEAYDVDQAGALVLERLVARLPGDPWKGRI